jgi:hypothetical protein
MSTRRAHEEACDGRGHGDQAIAWGVFARQFPHGSRDTDLAQASSDSRAYADGRRRHAVIDAGHL